MAAPGVDAIFLQLDAVVLPGYSRPLVRVADYFSAWWSGARSGTTGCVRWEVSPLLDNVRIVDYEYAYAYICVPT